MTKDYLTSPFNDDNIRNSLSKIIKSIDSLNLPQINTIPQDTFLNITHTARLIDETLRPMNDIVKNINNFNFVHESSVSSVNKMMNALNQLDVYRNLPDISKLVRTTSNFKIFSSNFQTLYDSVIKEHPVNTHQEKEDNDFPTNTKSEVKIHIETQKIETLKYAFFEFIVSCKLYKESLNHKISYSFDRILSNLGYSSALSTLISLAKPNDPLFLIIIFIITGVIQDIFKEK